MMVFIKKIFQIVLNKILGSMTVRGLISLGILLLIIYGAYSFLTLWRNKNIKGENDEKNRRCKENICNVISYCAIN